MSALYQCWENRLRKSAFSEHGAQKTFRPLKNSFKKKFGNLGENVFVSNFLIDSILQSVDVSALYESSDELSSKIFLFMTTVVILIKAPQKLGKFSKQLELF